MAEPVRWGVLSTARINDAVIRGARKSDRVEIVAVASRDQARADAYAREHGYRRAYGSYDALLADPDLEAVYISLPNSLHVEWSVRALEEGKHVLCEKPLDRSPDEVERAFDAAERADRFLMEAFMWRHHPQSLRLKQLVEEGAIGELRLIRSAFSFQLTRLEDVRMRPELQGGSLLDVGCYCVSAARLLAGEPDVVYGEQVLSPSGVDVRFAGTMRFPRAVIAHFDCAFDLPARSVVEAVGSEGSLVASDPFILGDARRLELRRDGSVETVDTGHTNKYQLEFENLSDAIRGRADPLLGRADALGQARTLDALLRSAESGEPVTPARS
ncbi:MAG: Gfo/Idh/MocA family oxidoreductase [Actinomycetota bacterium]|nr:Gfo/Idh/MocA family oxidoreductase [Actinomycetota bacterium]